MPKKSKVLYMSDNLILDLNGYFAKKYENYDLIVSVKSYESVTMSMILKNQNRIEQGEVASNEMRKIYYQPQAETVLKEVKEKYVDNNFSFSVRVIPFRRRVSNFFHKSYAPKTQIIRVIEKNGQNVQDLYKEIGVSEEIWKKVLKGKYLPEKSLIYKMAIALRASLDDVNDLLEVCEMSFDFSDARDVVMRFILDYRIYNPEMVKAILTEYKIESLLA